MSLKSCFIVTGPIQSGKTYFMSQLINEAKDQYPMIGFTEKCLYKGKDRIGYDLYLNLNGSHYQFPFVRIKERITLNDPNLFQFDNETITNVKKLLENKTIVEKPPLLYFDEYGKIESKGKGLFSAMKTIINQIDFQNVRFSTIFATRKQNLDVLLKNIGNDFNLKVSPSMLSLPCDEKTRRKFMDDIINSLR
ncbi:hypothetical protein TRFO_04158 [Tritrichomonas foetus]|uniref:Uncharacterized protein n=1 Tax=Tritrichomonas foetus TaxID=1144522 RepID=A0A1J4KI96_9EUKA|nr:hypothetical protein TRFO_04158 [Tritrichomonas foetus]|eukprot:OHT10656.1 hypothetical protein TRFO_04158 [Tritrichomonas foetus]